MIKLYDYWRSSACYRLRIAFHLKGLAFESEEVSLHPDVLAQNSDGYKAINPQQRVPTVVIDGAVHTQSMAILDWLEETYPEPALLPVETHQRLRARAFADTVACDIHPLNNSSVLKYLKEEFSADQAAVGAWYATWVTRGFDALEVHAQKSETRLLFGDAPGLAEICLIPQMYNARRFDIDLSGYPKLLEVEASCMELAAFQKAVPEAVKPA
ncbi:MAG: maleylacetoacetate isomerase [Hyphomonadaceae bacterium]|nr:maleylacetoacetate isomerase [Hyphomonadaceae bacterium]